MQNQNHENLKNLIIPRNNIENHEIHRIPNQNHKKYKKLMIPLQKNENHANLIVPTRITKFMKFIEFQSRIMKTMKI